MVTIFLITRISVPEDIFTIANSEYPILSHDVASRSEITPCNKIDKLLVVYRFSGNVMMSITSLRTK